MKSTCIICKREVANDVNECVCGCRRMIIGDNYIFDKTNVKCKCGCEKLKFNQSINCIDHHITGYKCMDCGNCITIYVYKDEDEIYY